MRICWVQASKLCFSLFEIRIHQFQESMSDATVMTVQSVTGIIAHRSVHSPPRRSGEESLWRTIDSLAALNYEDKCILSFIICNGNIGSGNVWMTPRIVLDILGVDPVLDSEPLLFKSVRLCEYVSRAFCFFLRVFSPIQFFNFRLLINLYWTVMTDSDSVKPATRRSLGSKLTNEDD